MKRRFSPPEEAGLPGASAAVENVMKPGFEAIHESGLGLDKSCLWGSRLRPRYFIQQNLQASNLGGVEVRGVHVVADVGPQQRGKND